MPSAPVSSPATPSSGRPSARASSSEPSPGVWFLAGATACGKTAVAHELARRHGAEILSADSMLVYRGMDIGTAKPTPAERAGIAYHGIDLVSPAEPCSAGLFLQTAEVAIRTAAAHGRPLVVVGGTGLYFDLLLHGLDGANVGGVPPGIRARYQALFDTGGLAALHAEAERRAPGALSRLADPANPRRVQRLLERLDMGLDPVPRRDEALPPPPGTPGESDGARGPGRPFREPHVILNIAPDVLAARIAARIDAMFADGLLDEVRALRAAYPAWSSTASGAIGYAEALAVLDGTLSPADAKERIAARTRQLAKRQRTWFRHRASGAAWLEGPLSSADVPAVADAVERTWGWGRAP